MTGERIAGRYDILRLLGRGGMAEVFLARQRGEAGFSKHVVIKRILPHLADDEDFVDMLHDEARTAAELRHPNIAHVFDVGQDGGRTYIAMEYVHGQDMRRVQRRAQREGGIPLIHALQMAIDTCAGLYSAHTSKDVKGMPLDIVHRDINPQNLLVSYDGVTKIVDFGIAKARSNQSNTETGVIKGKYSYMSPEQAGGFEIDARSDQFAVGIVLWELLAGKRLFKRAHDLATLAAVTDEPIPPPSRFAPITKSLDNVVMKALSRHPDDRFADCRAMMMALEDLLAEERMVHSSARVGAWMRELFADVLTKEELEQQKSPASIAAAGGVERESEREGTHADEHPSTFDDHLPSLELAALDSRFRKATGLSEEELPATQIGRRGQGPKADMSAASFAHTDPGETELMSSPPTFDSLPESPADQGPAKVVSIADATERAEPLHIGDDASETSTAGYVETQLDPSPTDPSSATGTSRTELIDRAQFQPMVKDDSPSWRVIAIACALGAVALLSTIVLALLIGPGTGKVIVETDPPGASVYLDGANTRRTTPTILDNVSVGVPHSIRVEKAGYPSQKFDLTLASPDDEPRVSLDLKD